MLVNNQYNSMAQRCEIKLLQISKEVKILLLSQKILPEISQNKIKL